jgi:hypothetical protein
MTWSPTQRPSFRLGGSGVSGCFGHLIRRFDDAEYSIMADLEGKFPISRGPHLRRPQRWVRKMGLSRPSLQLSSLSDQRALRRPKKLTPACCQLGPSSSPGALSSPALVLPGSHPRDGSDSRERKKHRFGHDNPPNVLCKTSQCELVPHVQRQDGARSS